MNRPICLWMTSRSRSSLVSKIFANHGVWWGDTLKKSRGYDTYENQVIKKIQKDIIKPKSGTLPYLEELDLTEETQQRFHQSLKQHIEDTMVKNCEKWSMKTGVEYFNAWRGLNPYNIFIKRETSSIAKSISEKRIGDYESAFHAANWRFEYMNRIQKEHGGVFINTDDIINGNYQGIREAMEYCGIDYNERAVESAITR